MLLERGRPQLLTLEVTNKCWKPWRHYKIFPPSLSLWYLWIKINSVAIWSVISTFISPAFWWQCFGTDPGWFCQAGPEEGGQYELVGTVLTSWAQAEKILLAVSCSRPIWRNSSQLRKPSPLRSNLWKALSICLSLSSGLLSGEVLLSSSDLTQHSSLRFSWVIKLTLFSTFTMSLSHEKYLNIQKGLLCPIFHVSWLLTIFHVNKMCKKLLEAHFVLISHSISPLS